MNVVVAVVLDTRLRGYDVSRIAELRGKAKIFNASSNEMSKSRMGCGVDELDKNSFGYQDLTEP